MGVGCVGVGVVGVRVCRYLDKRVGMGVYIGECVEKRAMGRGSGEGEEGGAGDGRSRGRKEKEGGQKEWEEAVVCNGETVQGREERRGRHEQTSKWVQLLLVQCS